MVEPVWGHETTPGTLCWRWTFFGNTHWNITSHKEEASYNLEGDGLLALTCYEATSTLNVAARQTYYPNLEAVACTITSDDDDMKEELIQHAKSCVRPGVTYYFNQLTTSMKQPLDAFKTARLFCPVKVQQMKPTISAVDTYSCQFSLFFLHKFLHSKRSFLFTWLLLKILIPPITHCVPGSKRNSPYLHGVG